MIYYSSAAKIITDRVTAAKEEMNAKFLDGWVIFVDPAKPRESRPPSQPQPSQTGFTSNKTIGWCGWYPKVKDKKDTWKL